MDSNSIRFCLFPSGVVPNNSSPQMIDEGSLCKAKSNSDESTNFIEYQQFKKASLPSGSGKSCNHESPRKASDHIGKKKIIQKQTRNLKQSEKQSKNANYQNLNGFSGRTGCGQISDVKNIQPKTRPEQVKKADAKKPLVAKSHSFASIFDWMMEVTSLMKLSRTVFYRACNILYEVYKNDPKVIENQNVERYTTACLLISAKLQKSNMDYLHELFMINKMRMSKQVITMTQISIYQAMNWKLPILNLVSEEILNVFEKWNNYLEKCEKQQMIKKETRERLRLNLKHCESQPLKNKTFGEILYVFDIMVLNQAKKYMNAEDLQNPNKNLITPIVIAMYAVFTIQNGDALNQQKFFLPLFKNFYRQQLLRSAIQIDKFDKQTMIAFMVFNFQEYISKIPLLKNWKEVIEQDLIAYLPVNVLRRPDSK